MVRNQKTQNGSQASPALILLKNTLLCPARPHLLGSDLEEDAQISPRFFSRKTVVTIRDVWRPNSIVASTALLPRHKYVPQNANSFAVFASRTVDLRSLTSRSRHVMSSQAVVLAW